MGSALQQSKSYTEEDSRRIQRRGLKIREMMLRGRSKLIRSHEYRLRTYANCFLGHEMVDLLLEKGEVRTRDAAKQLGRRLLQAGVIHHVLNEQDFRDEAKLCVCPATVPSPFPELAHPWFTQLAATP